MFNREDEEFVLVPTMDDDVAVPAEPATKAKGKKVAKRKAVQSPPVSPPATENMFNREDEEFVLVPTTDDDVAIPAEPATKAKGKKVAKRKAVQSPPVSPQPKAGPSKQTKKPRQQTTVPEAAPEQATGKGKSKMKPKPKPKTKATTTTAGSKKKDAGMDIDAPRPSTTVTPIAPLPPPGASPPPLPLDQQPTTSANNTSQVGIDHPMDEDREDGNAEVARPQPLAAPPLLPTHTPGPVIQPPAVPPPTTTNIEDDILTAAADDPAYWDDPDEEEAAAQRNLQGPLATSAHSSPLTPPDTTQSTLQMVPPATRRRARNSNSAEPPAASSPLEFGPGHPTTFSGGQRARGATRGASCSRATLARGARGGKN